MAGAIIENMSTKKLVIVGVILLLFQAFSFMVGGLIGEQLLLQIRLDLIVQALLAFTTQYVAIRSGGGRVFFAFQDGVKSCGMALLQQCQRWALISPRRLVQSLCCCFQRSACKYESRSDRRDIDFYSLLLRLDVSCLSPVPEKWYEKLTEKPT